MPLTSAQLVRGANYQLMTNAQNDPVDQITKDKPLAEWLIKNKKEAVFGNGIFNEKVRFTHASNYQNFSGDDQLSYNRRDTVRLAPFQHYESFDGFTLNETELANNGIVVTDDSNAVLEEGEKIRIVNLLNENWEVLKEGWQENFDREMHLDGQQDVKACPGLDLLVSTTPNIGVVGGIDAATAAYWRNNTNLNISTATAGNLTTEMESTWRACRTFGKSTPDFLPCGSKFYDAYKQDAKDTVNRQIVVDGKSGTDLDGSVENVWFKGKLLVWDPTFDELDEILGPIAVPWAKRCYFLSSKHLKLRPFKGRWMVKRTPPRVYDRHTHYFGQSADYGLTTNRRNANAVLSIQ